MVAGSQTKQIEMQKNLINNISKLAFELITQNNNEIDRILVLLHYKNTFYRKILLCFSLLPMGSMPEEFYKDRFITIAGHNHNQSITEGLVFNTNSITGKAYICGKSISENIDNKLGSSKENLQSVLSSPIIWDGKSIGTLNVDSSHENTFCTPENEDILETFAKVIADIIGDNLEGYMPYISDRYITYLKDKFKGA